MLAANSEQTKPSHIANRAPNIQPSMACGPPIAPMMSGRVMNGPTPTMSSMLRITAVRRPIPRTSLFSVPDFCMELINLLGENRRFGVLDPFREFGLTLVFERYPRSYLGLFASHLGDVSTHCLGRRTARDGSDGNEVLG